MVSGQAEISHTDDREWESSVLAVRAEKHEIGSKELLVLKSPLPEAPGSYTKMTRRKVSL